MVLYTAREKRELFTHNGSVIEFHPDVGFCPGMPFFIRSKEQMECIKAADGVAPEAFVGT